MTLRIRAGGTGWDEVVWCPTGNLDDVTAADLVAVLTHTPGDNALRSLVERQTRLLETRQDLDDLPVGTVIRDRTGSVYMKRSTWTYASRTGSWWEEVGVELSNVSDVIPLPARLLDTPEESR